MAIEGDINQINANLIGLWLQLLATGTHLSHSVRPLLKVLPYVVGAYFVYLPHCVAILVKKLRNGQSPWLPAACFLIFAATVLVSTTMI